MIYELMIATSAVGATAPSLEICAITKPALPINQVPPSQEEAAEHGRRTPTRSAAGSAPTRC